MANTGQTAAGTFQPAATQADQQPGGDQADNPQDWKGGFLAPVAIQVPTNTGVLVTYASGTVIKGPFVIRAVLLQTDNPKAGVYMRCGYATGPVTDAPSAASATNIFGQQGKNISSFASDGFPMLIAGTLLTPLYIPVDQNQCVLWASLETVVGAANYNAVATFFLDAIPHT